MIIEKGSYGYMKPSSAIFYENFSVRNQYCERKIRLCLAARGFVELQNLCMRLFSFIRASLDWTEMKNCQNFRRKISRLAQTIIDLINLWRYWALFLNRVIYCSQQIGSRKDLNYLNTSNIMAETTKFWPQFDSPLIMNKLTPFYSAVNHFSR